MNFYEYLPHEYSYAFYLAYEFDLHPYDSMISNMVSERYPREEDEECTSAYGSENCEENQVQNDDSSSVFATMANNDPDIVFGNFHQESNLEKVQMLSINTINPSIEGNSIKIGAITCFIDSAISQSIVPAFSSPIKVERTTTTTTCTFDSRKIKIRPARKVRRFLICYNLYQRASLSFLTIVIYAS
ncbi:hypothetical protein QL285_049751 [Trifolium repens]|nr:hypothetical protein QL285_049751 [Trifolium repens]